MTARSCRSERGFTMIELLVVTTLIVLLATMAMAQHKYGVVHAREAVLSKDLFTFRASRIPMTLTSTESLPSLEERDDEKDQSENEGRSVENRQNLCGFTGPLFGCHLATARCCSG